MTQQELVPPCAFCDKPSSWLCDGIIGRLAAVVRNPLLDQADERTQQRYPDRLVMDDSLTFFTCDLPLCDDHARKSSPLFMCRPCEVVYEDYCPFHAADDILAPTCKDLISAAEAETRRQDLEQRARRARQVVVSFPGGQRSKHD